MTEWQLQSTDNDARKEWLEGALAGARAQINALEDSAATSAFEIKELQMRVAELEGQLVRATKELTRLTHVEMLTTALANAEQSAQQQAKASEEAMAEIKRLEIKRITTSATEMARLTTEVARLTNEKDVMEKGFLKARSVEQEK